MLDNILFQIKKIIPKSLFKLGQPIYHYSLALLGALIYRFPSRKIFVIGITGTKGKTSVAELVNIILEEAGYKTALAGTLRFKIDKKSKPNKFKMTMPGRFFVQRFIRKAVDSKCDYLILEMTSEGTKQFRHKFIALNSLIFTNLAPEHIESHGSYENYLKAKLKIAETLEKSPKNYKSLIVNMDDAESEKFLNINVKNKITYSLSEAKNFEFKKDGLSFRYKNTEIESPLHGEFNIYNILSSIKLAETQDINIETIKKALKKFNLIRGRVEKINEGQDFDVIVDYAHTPDSLKKLYQAFPNSNKICVLGNTGGGRDTWKRKIMGSIADKYCSQIILTNEDPYDEDPLKIINDVATGIKQIDYDIIEDRKEAIKKAISLAKTGDTVLISGKGTDPYIMGPNNSKIEWDDATICRQVLKDLLKPEL
ncbi:UDP-N-acetylmuramoyl-L-alanyl-D-glutamate--2,6-diaminopimelate ligase [Patescibacteria group bacterium]|nr:UDP-N-acetylmuramoyl-L-alanyl-D-glutamate--2,6-diaminopimelate ligase [Patescibacteria group bacterium]